MKKTPKKKLYKTESDKLLEGLYEISRKGGEHAEKARSFINWWMSNQSWTENQWHYVRHLVHASKKPKKREGNKKYYVYAISDSTALKIGFTSDLSGRIRAMQTGHPTKLEYVWKYYLGTERAMAVKIEKCLHRLCKKEKIRGEWFKLSASMKLESFKLKRTKEDDLDIKTLISASNYI
jgi:Meiotically up-regulated gene 113